MKTTADLTDISGDPREYRQLIQGVLLTVLLVVVLAIAGDIIANTLSAKRVGFFFSALVVVSLSLVQLQVSVRRGAAVLILGLWLSTSTSMVAFSGVHSANMLIYPFLIVFTGWIMGRRWLAGVTVATLLLVAGLILAEFLGLHRPTPRPDVMAVSGILIGSLIAISFLTAVAYGSLTRERDRAVTLSREMALRNQIVAQRENDMKLIIENVPAGIASFDTEFRVRFANTRYASLFDLSPEQIVGKHVSEYVAAEALESLMPRWKQCLGGISVNYRRTNRDSLTGKSRVVDVKLVPEFEQGRVTGVFGLLIDVTDQVAAENQVRELNDTLERRVEERSAALERTMETLRHSQEELARSEARATLSTLVASVSHELGTPIGNSVMAASTLGDHARSFEALIDAGQIKRSDLNRITGALRDGTELLRRNLERAQDLLKNFRQVAADQASEQRRSFDLATATREIIDTLAPSLKRHPHRIVLDIPAGITLDSLPGPFGQVIINLINNAYLHAFDGRSDGLLTIAAEVRGRDVLIRVADNGCGISPENLKKLFQPFFSTKIGEGGTGLGMSIVENLVRKTLGGSITVHSDVGTGTRFELRLPLVAPGA